MIHNKLHAEYIYLQNISHHYQDVYSIRFTSKVSGCAERDVEFVLHYPQSVYCECVLRSTKPKRLMLRWSRDNSDVLLTSIGEEVPSYYEYQDTIVWMTLQDIPVL